MTQRLRGLLWALVLALGIVLVSGGSALVAASGARLSPTAMSFPPGVARSAPGEQPITFWRVLGPQRPAATATTCACVARAREAPPPWINAPTPDGGVPQVGGHVLLVSLAQQWLWAYDDQQLVYATVVTTGRPELPTPMGMFQVNVSSG